MSDSHTFHFNTMGQESGVIGRLSDGVMRRYRHFIRFGLIFGAAMLDVACFILAGWGAATLRDGGSAWNNMADAAALLGPIYMLAAIVLHAYDIATLRSLGRALMSAMLALLIAIAIGFFITFAMKVSAQFSRLETAGTLVLLVVSLGLVRVIGYRIIRYLFYPVIEQRILVLTDGVGAERPSGNPMTTVLDVRKNDIVPELSDPGFFDRVGRLARDTDRVVLVFSEVGERHLWARAMQLSGLDAEVVTDVGETRPIALSQWGGLPTLVISRGPLNLGERLVKRLFDLGVTSAMLVVFAPIIALFAVLVKLDSPGPAFFVQERVGRNNRSYRCFKLRSMRTESTDSAGGVSASRDDNRITRLGRFLRRTSIDELPQLFNVLIGDMSLVGPRPHALGSRAEGALFWELVPDYWSRHAMKPGVTGLAQVRGFRGATHHREDIEQRVAADLEYINNWSLWLDIKILLMTVRVAVHPNAY